MNHKNNKDLFTDSSVVIDFLQSDKLANRLIMNAGKQDFNELDKGVAYTPKAGDGDYNLSFNKATITPAEKKANLTATATPAYTLKVLVKDKKAGFAVAGVDKTYAGSSSFLYDVNSDRTYNIMDKSNSKEYSVFINPKYKEVTLDLSSGQMYYDGKVDGSGTSSNGIPKTGDNILLSGFALTLGVL